ncbi:MAG: hypothetical protein KGQ66_19595 [Acidobacteriota bacterium]|nr:hypothetical protein [Acidobacteriota bacterium]
MQARPVGVAVSAAFADLDDDWPILRAALAARALEPIPFTWDPTQGAASPATRGRDLDGDRPRSDRAPARRAGGRGDPPPGVEAVLVTYVWGYVSNREAFLAWAERTAPTAQLINPLPVLRWNTDKTYLADLDRAGIPTVPTTFLAPSQDWSPPSADYVVKPTVGSSGWLAARYVDADASAPREHVARRGPHGHAPAIPALRGRRRGDRHARLSP